MELITSLQRFASLALDSAMLLITNLGSEPFQVDPDVLRSAAAAETAPGKSSPSGHAQGAATFRGQASAHAGRLPAQR